MFDLIIKKGSIVDGTGKEMFRGDIAVKDGKIISIGDLEESEAKAYIEAKGLIVSPGFIESHGHAEIFPVSFPANKIRQGVTTEIIGHCGVSLYPYTKEGAGNVRKMFEMADPSVVDLQQKDLETYFTNLENNGVSYNCATLIGYGTLRAGVVGLENREATKSEIEEMKRLLENDMRHGALGMSTGIEYFPQCFCAKEELIELAKVVAKYDGVYATHMRNENDYLIESVEEAIEIAEKSRAKLMICHLKALKKPNWGKVKKAIELIKEARNRGVDVWCDSYFYPLCASTLAYIMPKWALEGGLDELAKRLKNEDTKEKITKELSDIDFKEVFVFNLCSEKNKKFNGENIETISAVLGETPYETYFRLFIEEKGILAVFRLVSEEDMDHLAKFEYALVGSDAFPHADNTTQKFCHPRDYGTFPRFIRKYVKDEKIISLEEAIRKMTKLTADFYGIPKRGSIEVGNYADFTIFNLDDLKDNATIKQPAQYNEGIEYVIINGKIQLEQDDYKKENVGQIVKRAISI